MLVRCKPTVFLKSISFYWYTLQKTHRTLADGVKRSNSIEAGLKSLTQHHPSFSLIFRNSASDCSAASRLPIFSTYSSDASKSDGLAVVVFAAALFLPRLLDFVVFCGCSAPQCLQVFARGWTGFPHLTQGLVGPFWPFFAIDQFSSVRWDW